MQLNYQEHKERVTRSHWRRSNPQKALRQQLEVTGVIKDAPRELLRRNLISNRKDQVSIRVKPNIQHTLRFSFRYYDQSHLKALHLNKASVKRYELCTLTLIAQLPSHVTTDRQ